ncbi:MAG: bifunctional histidine phosphatase family protein/GNAT family N-acetyltransferase [Oscillospiraceae bacterium]|nr:bifunctional histidine phosphatase family protein/GNAT family N-acetyltransferase [Oscillospiraceae bacterium]
MTTLYLIRHAEAEGNIYRRAHGHYNSMLTPNGKKQLEKLSDWAKNCRIDAVYASDLNRTMHTAMAVADVHGLDVLPRPDLREISLGEWEDLPWGRISVQNRETLRSFNSNTDFCIPGGETYAQASGRFNASIECIVASHPCQTVAVVAHGCVIKYFLDRISSEPIPHLDNASVSCAEYDEGKYIMKFFNKNNHLGNLSTFSKQTWWKATGNRDLELWFDPLRLPGQEDAAAEYGLACWHSVYGTSEGFDRECFLANCRESLRESERGVQFVKDENKIVGFLQIRPSGVLSSWDSHIGMFYLDEAFQGKGIGVQLAGEAVSLAREMGKAGLTLRVWHKNQRAVRFYESVGFTGTGRESGTHGDLLQMRLDISMPEL